MRNVRMRRVIAVLSIIAMLLTFVPAIAVADGEIDVPASAPKFSQSYTAMRGVALDADVKGMSKGASYIAYWGNTAYTFVVGTDVFADFESAYGAILDKKTEANIFLLTGEHGDLTITDPVTIYGNYYGVNPNQAAYNEIDCPPLNGARQHDRESCVSNVYIDENLRGQVTLDGVVLQGNLVDAYRPINSDATDITVKNCIVRHEQGVPAFDTWAFYVDNGNNQDISESAANNNDSFTIKNCRIEHLETKRICSNIVAPIFTVDGLVTVSGATTFFGLPQWRRYTKSPTFTMKNCHFEDFKSAEGRTYFMVLEGMNKHNGNCTINIENNTFRGDATSHIIEIFTKSGYDINIKGNTFIARSKTGLEPFKWNTSYDNVYSDSAANANVSSVNLSSIMEIEKNRFVGYTKFSNTVNSYTTFDISDNFFTNDLENYKTCLGGFPAAGTGWSASSYWVDFALETYGTTIPNVVFTSSEVTDNGSAKVLYSSASSVNLYDYGFTLPKGVNFSLSSGESASSVSVSSGLRTVQIKVYSYDGTRSANTALMIYGRSNYASAVAALQEAYVRINSGCYTAATLSAYQTAANQLASVLSSGSDPSAAVSALEIAEGKLVFVSGAEAEMKYYDYFPTLKKFKIVDKNDWIKFTKTITATVNLSGYTIRLVNDIDFGGAAINPVGGCYASVSDSEGYSFNGTLDGGGHTLSNFVINKSAYGVGLFGKLNLATIKNLQITNATISGIDKVGAVAGYADSSTIRGVVNKASVSATDGNTGVAGIASQARGGSSLIGCINYGSVSAANGRACGITAWGQTTALLKYCFNYGTLSGKEVQPLAVYNTDNPLNYDTLVVDCFYQSGNSACGGNLISVFEQFSNEELNEFAWKSGLNLHNGVLVPDGAGTKIYRATLTCTTNGKTYYYYGPANSAVYFDIPGYVIETVYYNGANRPLGSFLLTKDCTMTGAATRVTYSITYHLDGGSAVIDLPATYTADTYTALPSVGQVTKSGYVFYGFYDNASFSGAPIYSIPEDSEGDRHLYAKYIPLDRTITTSAQLVSFANAVNSGSNFAGKAVLIGADINMSGVTYPVIGSSVATPFQGLLYGGAHTISNLSVSGKGLAGVVGCLGENGTVAGMVVNGTVSGNVAGGIVAQNQGGDVLDCYFNGKANSSTSELKIVSQNLCVSWVEYRRCEPLVDSLLSNSPDIIGLQEASDDWRSYLEDGLSDYGYIWQYRGSGSNTTSSGLEATPIFYKKSTLTLLSSGSFWFSDTPDKPSYCWNEDNDHNRICTWGKFQVKATGEVFWHFNTHFPLKEENRLKAAALLKSKVQSLVTDEVPFLMTADWNFTPGMDSYRSIDAWSDDMMMYADVNASEGLSSVNDDWGTTPESGANIDMLFGDTERIRCTYYSLLIATYVDSNRNTWSVSDHWGVYYRIRLDSASGGLVGMNYGHVSNSIATNSGTAEKVGGVLCGVNAGTIENCAVFSGTPVGRDEGSTSTVTVANATKAAYTLNDINEARVWGVNGSNLVLIPAGNQLYNVSYYDNNGNLLKTELTSLSAARSWKPSLDTAQLVFSHWEETVFSNYAIFTAVLKTSSFSVVFYDAAGKAISTQKVDYGKAAVPPAVTTPAGKTFAGWNGNYSNVTSDMNIYPVFVDSMTFNLTVQTEGDGNGLSVNGVKVAAGKSYTAAAGTEFVLCADSNVLYWKDESGKILSESARIKVSMTRHTTLTAVYPTDSRVTVTFVDIDNTILKTQVLRAGRNAVAPSTPARDGLVFSDWEGGSIKSVQEDLILRAVYVSGDLLNVSVVGGTASAKNVHAGECVTFTAGAAPSGKSFVGWSLDGVNVISTKKTFSMTVDCDITLTALYTAAEYRPVAVMINDNGTVTLDRHIEGDYTVLGGGLLYGNSLNVMMELECVDGVNIHQINDARLTRNGSMTALIEAVYVRGFAVLLDETTGDVVVFYTAVTKIS